jgi:hypothetical protein
MQVLPYPNNGPHSGTRPGRENTSDLHANRVAVWSFNASNGQETLRCSWYSPLPP